VDMWELSRGEKVEVFRDAPIRRRPPCSRVHLEHREAIPLDWPHTLQAVYQVRCNLFHGEKGANSESDREIVTAALRAMLPFLSETLGGDQWWA